ncbi:PspA-associated protein PspAA [Nocardioides marmoraquaticus]
MIVRIMGEGQLEVADEHLERLNALDADVESAVEAGDETAFAGALESLLGEVRSVGTEVDADFLHDSDLILPPADASLEEVRGLLGDEGLIPG